MKHGCARAGAGAQAGATGVMANAGGRKSASLAKAEGITHAKGGATSTMAEGGTGATGGTAGDKSEGVAAGAAV